MCGIVALYSAIPGRIEPRLVEAMRDAMEHRGPDDAGAYCDQHVGLGHRRLSIQDLSSAGHQPMADASGELWVCYNGEIYNFPQLRSELETKGYRFRTHCDTEVLLALYEIEGEEAMANRLNGIFAFALWDRRRRRLVLVRDRVGIKPLYLWQGDGYLAAASEVKALLLHPAVPRAVRHDAIAEYLTYRQVSAGRTLFADIEMVAPGEMVVVEDGRVKRHTYWQLPRNGGGCNGQGAEAVGTAEALLEGLDGLMRDATHLQMLSDVPLGTFNSGGVDSSLVTSYVAEKAGHHLNTFCIGLEDPRLDERPYAEQVAAAFQTDHRHLVVTTQDFADHLPKVLWHHDEPLTHPNTLPIYLLSRLAREHVTVVLTGEGADELFGGYPRYRLAALLEDLGPVGRRLGGLLASVLPWRPANRWGKVLGALEHGAEAAIAQVSRHVAADDLDRVLRLDAADGLRFRQAPQVVDGDIVAAMLAFDQRNYLLPILHRLDKASMAWGLEARVPFLDHRLLEFAATVPSSLKVRRNGNKILVKDLARRRLPRDVVDRKKSGLAMPLETWLRQEDGMGRYLDMLLEPRARQRDYLDGTGVTSLVEEHRSQRANHAELLWGLLNLELWHRVMLEGEGV